MNSKKSIVRYIEVFLDVVVMFTSYPVSYTHLEILRVLKPGGVFVCSTYSSRTRHRALAPLGFHCTRHPDCHNRTVHGPVSYTHLDVYKRQLLTLFRRHSTYLLSYISS